jgi:hypothetical protein
MKRKFYIAISISLISIIGCTNEVEDINEQIVSQKIDSLLSSFREDVRSQQDNEGQNIMKVEFYPLTKIAADNKENPLNAEKVYTGRKIRTSGKIESIDKDFDDNPYIRIVESIESEKAAEDAANAFLLGMLLDSDALMAGSLAYGLGNPTEDIYMTCYLTKEGGEQISNSYKIGDRITIEGDFKFASDWEDVKMENCKSADFVSPEVGTIYDDKIDGLIKEDFDYFRPMHLDEYEYIQNDTSIIKEIISGYYGAKKSKNGDDLIFADKEYANEKLARKYEVINIPDESESISGEENIQVFYIDNVMNTTPIVSDCYVYSTEEAAGYTNWATIESMKEYKFGNEESSRFENSTWDYTGDRYFIYEDSRMKIEADFTPNDAGKVAKVERKKSTCINDPNPQIDIFIYNYTESNNGEVVIRDCYSNLKYGTEYIKDYHSTRDQFTYNNNKKLTNYSHTTFTPQGEVYDSYVYDRTYNDLGKITTSNMSYQRSDGKKSQTSNIITYDETGKLTETKITVDGKTTVYKYYNFDNVGNWTLCKAFGDSDSDCMIIRRIFKYVKNI